jgi:autotransporter strand-loop-strand O-heptosyltransferase
MIYDNIKFNSDIIRKPKPHIYFNNIYGPKVEIKNSPDDKYLVSFIDINTGITHHSSEIGNDCWVSCNISYYKEWRIKIEKDGNDFETIDFNLEGKSVFINIDSRSLGDNLAWVPYVEEFRKKHNCQVHCSTFWNHLFVLEYPEIKFVPPGSTVHGLIAQYRLGWFYDLDNNVDYWKCPFNFRNQPMQKVAADILGLEYKETKPLIKLSKNIEKENLITIALHGTAQSKYWNNTTGWQDIVDFAKSKGYRVMLISKESDGYMGNSHPIGIEKLESGPIENVIETLQKSKLFIGIGSGLSWLSWATGTTTCIISGFSYDYTEPSGNGVVRVSTPPNFCTGCFNDDKLDPGDWNWCPKHKGTDRQFECSKSITSQMVIDKISPYL